MLHYTGLGLLVMKSIISFFARCYIIYIQTYRWADLAMLISTRIQSFVIEFLLARNGGWVVSILVGLSITAVDMYVVQYGVWS